MYLRIADTEQGERTYSHLLARLNFIAFRQFPWLFLFFSSLHLYVSETNLGSPTNVLADGFYLTK